MNELIAINDLKSTIYSGSHESYAVILKYNLTGFIKCLDNEWSRVRTGYISFLPGTKIWFKHGMIHREDGPAIIHHDGTQRWLRHGCYHREDGPSIIHNEVEKLWYLNNTCYSEESYYFIKRGAHVERPVQSYAHYQLKMEWLRNEHSN